LDVFLCFAIDLTWLYLSLQVNRRTLFNHFNVRGFGAVDACQLSLGLERLGMRPSKEVVYFLIQQIAGNNCNNNDEHETVDYFTKDDFINFLEPRPNNKKSETDNTHKQEYNEHDQPVIDLVAGLSNSQVRSTNVDMDSDSVSHCTYTSVKEAAEGECSHAEIEHQNMALEYDQNPVAIAFEKGSVLPRPTPQHYQLGEGEGEHVNSTFDTVVQSSHSDVNALSEESRHDLFAFSPPPSSSSGFESDTSDSSFESDDEDESDVDVDGEADVHDEEDDENDKEAGARISCSPTENHTMIIHSRGCGPLELETETACQIQSRVESGLAESENCTARAFANEAQSPRDVQEGIIERDQSCDQEPAYTPPPFVLELKAKVAEKQIAALRSAADSLDAELSTARLKDKALRARGGIDRLMAKSQQIHRSLLNANASTEANKGHECEVLPGAKRNDTDAHAPEDSPSFFIEASVLSLKKAAMKEHDTFSAGLALPLGSEASTSTATVRIGNSNSAFLGDALLKIQKIQLIESETVRVLNGETDIVRQGAEKVSREVDMLKSQIVAFKRANKIRDATDFQLFQLSTSLDQKISELQGIHNLLDEKKKEIAVRVNRRDSACFVLQELEVSFHEMCHKVEVMLKTQSGRMASLAAKMEKEEREVADLETSTKKILSEKRRAEKELDDGRKHRDGSGQAELHVSLQVTVTDPKFQVDEMWLFLESQINSMEATLIEQKNSLLLLHMNSKELPREFLKAQTNVHELKRADARLRRNREKFSDGKKDLAAGLEAPPKQPPLSEKTGVAQQIRDRSLKHRSEEEQEWVQLDTKIHGHLYRQQLSGTQTLLEVAKDHSSSRLGLQVDDVKRILQLPKGLHVAMPFLQTEEEMRAHFLLHRFAE
jgi:hypothetical protein